MVVPKNVKVPAENVAYYSYSLKQLVMNKRNACFWYVSTPVQLSMLQMSGVGHILSNYVNVVSRSFYFLGSGVIYFELVTWVAATIALY